MVAQRERQSLHLIDKKTTGKEKNVKKKKE
jgi:hypothetical protein